MLQPRDLAFLGVRRAGGDGPNHLGEALRVWLAIRHDLPERLDRLKLNVVAAGASGVQVQPVATESFVEGSTVRRGGNRDHAVPGAQPRANVLADCLHEGCVDLVELDEVLRRTYRS